MLFDGTIAAAPHGTPTLLQTLALGADSLGRRARAALELWLEGYPPEAHKGLLSRLLADDTEFLSAFFELYLHALFSQLGYEAQLHPSVSNEHERAPDFLMSRHGQARNVLGFD